MKLILPACILIILSSCSPFQYFTLSGNNISKNQKDEFVAENDTLRIVYRFNGYHGPVKITLYNKTNEPIEINWKKSALIFNERATGYYSPNLYLNGTARTDTSRLLSFNSLAVSDVKADIYVNEPSQYIPPRSSLEKVPLTLPVNYFQNNELAGNEKQTSTSSTGYRFRYRRIGFTPEQSPAILRSYLSFSMGSTAREFSLDHSFYVSEIWESASGPEYLREELLEKPDRFYVRAQILVN
jgi:hypothetical protein